MTNVFQHYYRYEVSFSNASILDLVKKVGYYEVFEQKTPNNLSFKITSKQALHRPRNTNVFINPFSTTWKGLVYLNNSRDAIIVIGNPRKQTIEFLVSENNQKIEHLIFDIFSKNDFSRYLEEFRS